MATAPTAAITRPGPILPIHVSSPSPHPHRHQPPHTAHCPPSPTLHPDSPAPHTHTPLIHSVLLTYTPSTLVHRSPREIFHAGLLTPSPHFAHPHPPPHTLLHTQVPACLPSTLSTLSQDTLGSPPTGTLASSHCLYTLLHTNSTQKAAIYFHCHPETFPSQPFPFTVFLLSGSPRAPLSGPSAYTYCPLPFCPRLTCPQSHTHTHQGSQYSHTLAVAAAHTSNTLFPEFPHSLHVHLSITISVTAPRTPK